VAPLDHLDVLVVDDDPVSRLATKSIVERLGHACTVASDGAEALAVFGRVRPAALITDWCMPGVDGTQLTRRVRELEGEHYTYIIVLTGEADAESALAAMRAGADELVAKPLHAAQLERQLISARRVIDLQDRLRTDARLDALTGVPNRRAMTEELDVMVQQSQRYRQELAIAILDLDRFKAYNDTAGHPAGDVLLRCIAATLQHSLRGSDRIYRYGGEEFLALLPAQQEEGATIAGRRLCAAVREMAIAHPAGGLVTVSAGVATLTSDETPDQLLSRADAALYAAKGAGRDCVRTAPAVLASLL
jgi:diguanylate cyclase (GGDEF)-like protein